MVRCGLNRQLAQHPSWIAAEVVADRHPVFGKDVESVKVIDRCGVRGLYEVPSGEESVGRMEWHSPSLTQSVPTVNYDALYYVQG